MTHETSLFTLPPTMRAAVYDRFGGPDVVRLADMPVPRPGPNDILIRVVASTVSAADHRMRARDLPPGVALLAMPVVGLFRPRRRILGMDFAGTVAAVGNAVTRFAPGDDVVGMTGSAFGGHAEFLMLPQSAAIAIRPADLGHEEALGLVFGGHTVSECIRRREVRPGDDVLVNGASGAVGSAAVQVAKHFGARVTAVASADNAGLLARLGADRIIDYRTEDFSGPLVVRPNHTAACYRGALQAATRQLPSTVWADQEIPTESQNAKKPGNPGFCRLSGKII